MSSASAHTLRSTATTVLARLAMVVAMLMWVGGQLAGSIHELETVHLQCLEHGHTIERGLHDEKLAAHEAIHGHEHDELHAAPDCGDHAAHCPMQMVPSVAELPALVVAALPTPAFVVDEPAATDAPARGPPLRFAPKTGPPTTA